MTHAITKATALEDLRDLLNNHAQQLTMADGMPALLAHSAAHDAIVGRAPDLLSRTDQRPVPHPLYNSVGAGEIIGGFFRSPPTLHQAARGMADLIASSTYQATEAIGSSYGEVNALQFVTLFGPEVVRPLVDQVGYWLDDIRPEHVRYEQDEHGDDAILHIDDFDAQNFEHGFTRCAPDAEHAMEIFRFERSWGDEDGLDRLTALLTTRVAAAKAVLRGERPQVVVDDFVLGMLVGAGAGL